MPSTTQQQRILLYAVDIANCWVGTDVVREALIRVMRPDGLNGVLLAKLAPLDAHPADDRTALEGGWTIGWSVFGGVPTLISRICCSFRCGGRITTPPC